MARGPGLTGHRDVMMRPQMRFVAEIWDPITRRPVRIGTFHSQRDASVAYNAAIPRFYGPSMGTSELVPIGRIISINVVDPSHVPRPPAPQQLRSAPLLPSRVNINLSTLPYSVRQCLMAEIARRRPGVNRFHVNTGVVVQIPIHPSILNEPPPQGTRNPRDFDLNMPPQGSTGIPRDFDLNMPPPQESTGILRDFDLNMPPPQESTGILRDFDLNMPPPQESTRIPRDFDLNMPRPEDQ